MLMVERILSRCGLEAAEDTVCKTKLCARLRLLECLPTICTFNGDAANIVRTESLIPID